MFAYSAQAPWPIPQPQIDWVDQVITLEHWLNTTVGNSNWEWVKNTGPAMHIAFKHPKHVTLFLLRWTA